MRIVKLMIVFITLSLSSTGGYLYYKYEYVDTLMLSEIIGRSEKPLENFLTDIFDFDTGLTRHDVKKLKQRKNYWLKRMNQVNEIENPEVKANELAKLYEEMREDKAMNKVLDKFTEKTGQLAGKIFDILN